MGLSTRKPHRPSGRNSLQKHFYPEAPCRGLFHDSLHLRAEGIQRVTGGER